MTARGLRYFLCFEPPFSRQGGTIASSAITPCLIGGSGRSGTTLLRQIFEKHPRVAAFPTETRFLIDPDGIVDFYASSSVTWSPYLFDRRLKRLRRLLDDVGSNEFARGYGRMSRADVQRPPAGPVAGSLSAAKRWLKESRFLPRYFDVNLTKSCPEFPRLAARLVEELTEFRFEGRWGGAPRWEASEMAFGRPEPKELRDVLGGFVLDVFGCVARRQGASHVVEDSPYNHLAFRQTHELMPGSRLVHIYRDPRDVVASLAGMVWAPSDPLRAARQYVGIHEEWKAVRAELTEDSFVEVSLEDLVARPEEVLRRICAFLELEWSPSLLTVDLSRSHSGRWRSDVPAETHAGLERVLRPVLDDYGYE